MGPSHFSLLLILAGCWEALGAEHYSNSPVCNTTLSNGSFPWTHYRLPTSVVPEHYYIYIHPDLNTKTVTGYVQILIEALNDTSYIVLNGKNLTITGAFLKELSPNYQRKRLALHVLESVPTEQLAFISEIPLVAGRKYQLSVRFCATLSNSFSGVYRASYWTKNGISRMIAATHFEPTSARKAFPCFDEPNMKAVFSVVIVRDYNRKAISNMPKVSTRTRGDGLLEDHFCHSVRMSSYLVAFVVNDFSSNSTKSKTGTEVSIFAPRDQINQTRYALQAAVKILEFFEEYFQIPYPLPKIDLVAIPDFEAGAMENWGLITYRETSLLYDPHTSSPHSKLWVTLVTAHELAHQWFGNLVTMQWWNDLWLNEGFASYMEYVATNHLEPSWCVEDQLLTTSVYRALEKDSFMTSHPISLPVKNSQQIRQMFDVVSYCKGASILRMLHNYLTEDVFTQGIRDYLKQHSYKNAQQDDLWEALEKSALKEERKVEVKAIMDTWTTQKGYPLVSVKVDGRKLKLHQDIFSLYPENGKSFLWQIPFTFYTSNSPSVITHLMRKREETIDLHHDVAWIKANVNSTGFYRVSYDPHTLHVIIRQLQESHTVFSKADRASLIDDTFHLASQGSVQFSDAFALCLFVKEEREYLPIRMFMAHIGKMMSKFSFSRQRCALGLLKDHLWTLLGGLIQAQHWEEGGSLSQQKLRTLLLATGIGLHSPSSRQRAQELFHHWMAADGKIQLPRMLRGLIFRMGIRRGGHREWMFLLQQYLRTVSSSDKVLLLSALSRTRNPNKRKWLLETALQNRLIKIQDFAVIVGQLANSVESNELVWRFVRHHWDELQNKFSLGSSYLSRIVVSITSKFNSKEKYEEVWKFFVSEKKLGGLAFVKQSLEIIKVNMLWLQRNMRPVKAWLQQQYPHTYATYSHCRTKVSYRFVWGAAIHIRY